jgi:hypothetical protein
MRHRPHPGAEAEEGKWEGDRGPARRAPGGGGGGGVRRHRHGRGEGGRRSGNVTARASRKQGREARGPVRGGEKGKWAGPIGIVNFLIYSNNFQMSLNCFDQKVDLPSSKNFK